jgi:hypothetical protein
MGYNGKGTTAMINEVVTQLRAGLLCHKCKQPGHFARDCLNERVGTTTGTGAQDKRLESMEKNFLQMKEMIMEIIRTMKGDHKPTARANEVEATVQEGIQKVMLNQIENDRQKMRHAGAADEERWDEVERRMSNMMKVIENIPGLIAQQTQATMDETPATEDAKLSDDWMRKEMEGMTAENGFRESQW